MVTTLWEHSTLVLGIEVGTDKELSRRAMFRMSEHGWQLTTSVFVPATDGNTDPCIVHTFKREYEPGNYPRQGN